MRLFQYLIVLDLGRINGELAELNELGQIGWELVFIDRGAEAHVRPTYYFKREIK